MACSMNRSNTNIQVGLFPGSWCCYSDLLSLECCNWLLEFQLFDSRYFFFVPLFFFGIPNRFWSYPGRWILMTSLDDLFLNKRGLFDVFDEQLHVFLLHAYLNNYALPETAWTRNGKLSFCSFPCNNMLRKMIEKTWQKIKAIFYLPCLRMVRKNLTRSVCWDVPNKPITVQVWTVHKSSYPIVPILCEISPENSIAAIPRDPLN